MSVNKDRPHILVLPEDDADRQLANGFLLGVTSWGRQIQVLPEAGGWMKVLEEFQCVHAGEMDTHPRRLMLLLIDFDGQNALRFEMARDHYIPKHQLDRVFVLASPANPKISSVRILAGTKP